MNKNIVHVGFDCDGVLRKLRLSIIEKFIDENPEHENLFRDPEDFDTWDFRTSFKFFDRDVYNQLVDFGFNNPKTSFKCYKEAEHYPEVNSFSRYYNMLKKAGIEVSICTKQGTPWTRIATIQWLKLNQVDYDHIITCNENVKHIFGLDYLLDDHSKNVADVDSVGATGVLMEQGWNKKEKPKVKRSVSSIEEYVNLILNNEL